MRIDRNSLTWQAIEEYLQSRLTELREKNDDMTLDDRATVQVRAEIRVVKDLLALPDDQGVPAIGGSSSYL